MAKSRNLEEPSPLLPLKREPERSGVLLDLDGTLSPLVDDPAEAPFPRETRELVARLAHTYALVSIVSGRAADALRTIVGLDGIAYVGNHGLEVVRDGEREVLVAPAAVKRLAHIAEELERRLRRGPPGIFFEGKELSLAIHYRRAPDEQAARRFIQDALAGVDLKGFRVKGGKKLLQVRPDVGIDKGVTVMMLLDRARLPNGLYAGDDLTDVDVFRAFRGASRPDRYLISIGVVDAETHPEVVQTCDYIVEGIPGMRRVLEWLIV